VVNFRSNSSRSPRRYERRMRSVQRPPRRRPLRTWRSIRTRRFVPSTQSRSAIWTTSCTRRTASATATSRERSSKRWLKRSRRPGNPNGLKHQVFSSLLTPTGSVGALISVHDISAVLDEAASMLPCALSLWIATPLHQVLVLAGPATALQQLLNMKVLCALITT
jgi:hypothetical protein